MKKEIIYDNNFEEMHEDYRLETNPYYKTHMNLVEKNIKEALAKLPENLASVFMLYQIHGMKYREISKILDIPLNTVKVNLLRARKKLQKELYKYELQEVV